MLFSKSVTKLQEELDALRAENESLKNLQGVKVTQDAIAERDAALAKVKEFEENTHAGVLASVKQQRDNLSKALEELKTDFNAKVEAAVEAKVGQAIIDRCASAGIEPIRRDNQAGLLEADGDGTMSRKDFEALSPGAARQFIRQGGRVTR